jgi:hypothetical protein
MKQNLSDYERFLKPIHLKGEALTLTIVKFTEEETHPQRGKAELALVAWFREVPFGFILSPTNRQILADTCDSLAGWVGKPITLRAVSIGKVGKTDRSPIRIVNTRPAAPKIDTQTGEIKEGESVVYPIQPDRIIEASAISEPTWPTTEAEFMGWLKSKNLNGQATHAALGTDAKGWLRLNAGKTWADVAKTIAATLGS